MKNKKHIRTEYDFGKPDVEEAHTVTVFSPIIIIIQARRVSCYGNELSLVSIKTLVLTHNVVSSGQRAACDENTSQFMRVR